ncbi:MAG: YcxB family protein [Candidatus Eremiobacteraeota bacterium]|nr:YcxB family protein [Candidatus Eremiobacteraeota bacterium]
MKLEYEITADDYANAIRLDYSASPLFARWWPTLLNFCIVPAVLLATGDLGKMYANLGPGLFVPPIVLLVGLEFYGKSRKLLKKQFLKTGVGGPVGAQIDEKGLELAGAHANGLTKWSGIVRWLESADLFLVYPQPRLFFILPKRALQPDEIAEFRDRLINEVGAKSVCRTRQLLR